MAANEQGEKRSAEDSFGEEPVYSLQDVLEEDDALEDEACAVLGGSDAEKCSYSEGYVKRQALYACSTCTSDKEEPAGICLACTYKCHEGHDLIELYTKRNFRCDCGNGKFKQLECKFFPEKEKFNTLNKYNQNFHGVYCTCKRPYPDPEDEIPDEMIQCIVCEDWFHGRHLGAVPPDHVEYQEMVCQVCMDRCPFLWAYASQLAAVNLTEGDLCRLVLQQSKIPQSKKYFIGTVYKVCLVSPTVTKMTPAEGVLEDIKVDDSPVKDVKLQNGSSIKTEEQKDEEMTNHQVKEEGVEKANDPSTSTESEKKLANGEASHPVKTEDSPGIVCKLKEIKTHLSRTNTATYWPSNWRQKLCTCGDCMKMYAELGVLFLMDENDTVQVYENKGRNEESAERRDPLMTALNSMNRVQQVELICEYNDLKTELKDYLKKFAEEGKVVRTEDIQHFFEDLRSRKRRRVDGMQYYCS